MKKLFLTLILIGLASCSKSPEQFSQLEQLPEGCYKNSQGESIVVTSSKFTLNEKTTSTEFKAISLAFVSFNDSEQLYSFTVEETGKKATSGILKKFFGYKINEKNSTVMITFHGKGYMLQ